MKTIFIIAILALLILAGCQQQVQENETEELTVDELDAIPDISMDECLTAIKQTNPEMPEQDAKDNCMVIEAINKGNQSLCDQVSEDFKASCLAAFE